MLVAATPAGALLCWKAHPWAMDRSVKWLVASQGGLPSQQQEALQQEQALGSWHSPRLREELAAGAAWDWLWLPLLKGLLLPSCISVFSACAGRALSSQRGGREGELYFPG